MINPFLMPEKLQLFCMKTSLNYSDSMKMASDMLKDSQIAKAARIIRDNISKDLLNPLGFNLMGISYELEGDIINSIKCYRIAIQIDSSYAPSISNLSRITAFSLSGNDFGKINYGT